MGTKFCYSPLKIFWTYKESAKKLVIRIWFYAFLWFYFFKNSFIVNSENKYWWNLYWNTDGCLLNCAFSLMCYESFSGCPNFYFRLSHFLFHFNIPPNLQLHCTILDGYQIQNDLTLCIVNAIFPPLRYHESPCSVMVSFSGLFLMWDVCFLGSCKYPRGLFTFFNQCFHCKNIWAGPLVSLLAISTGNMTVRPVMNWKYSCLYVDVGTETAALK